MTIDLDKLEAAARAAHHGAPGPWQVEGPSTDRKFVANWDGLPVARATCFTASQPDVAAHIAAANPAAVLDLVAELRAARAVVEVARELALMLPAGGILAKTLAAYDAATREAGR